MKIDIMSVEIGGRNLRSRSRTKSIPKTKKEKSVVLNESGSNFSSSFTSSKDETTSFTKSLNVSSVSSYGENGIISSDHKEMDTSSQGTSYANNDDYDSEDTILDDGGHTSDGRNWHFDDNSPWQNGKFKSAEEIVKYYKQFGDWWNLFPKTDYVYSTTSKWYCQEIAPGIPVIPNLSRPPLHPTPQHIKNRWQRDMFLLKCQSQPNNINSASASNSRVKQLFLKVVTVITTVFSTIWRLITSLFSRNDTITKTTSTSGSAFTSSELYKTSQVNSSHLLKEVPVASELNVWWRAPFRWIYRLSSWFFLHEVIVLLVIGKWFFSKNKYAKKKSILRYLLLPLLILLIALLGWLYRDKLSDDVILLSDNVSSTSISLFNVVSNFLFSSISYFYGLLPVLKQNHSPNPVTQGNIDNEQLTDIVQQTVRETLKKHSAILLEDTVNHPRFKVLMEKALAEKTGSWNPTTLLADGQWKAAIKDIVEQHYSDISKKENIEEYIKNVEKKADWSANEVVKLQESSGKLQERVLALERGMQSIIQQFITHQHLEAALKNLTMHLQYQSKIDEEHVIEKILSEVTIKVKGDVNDLFKSLKENQHQVEIINGDINFDQVKGYVSAMIDRALALYDADKIGMVDYALESSGGIIVSTRCTESYNAGHKTYILFGFALWHRSNSPRTVIQPGVHPGECWAFAGQQGYLVIQLSATIIVTAFTVEHIPPSLAPQGRIDSAPKDFSVWGLKYESDVHPIFLGRFWFLENGTSLQKFEALTVQEPFRLVELKIESNHGNLEYTCLYRFRVHGVPVS
ncbi:uncharacterized protein LOC142329698 [Lycorma delicatula]|uniref:uncharacterized protein LOC142329698 n=1 Tax=Lycorma delicatula TaxID=130591 RepID=UPI003F511F27